MNKLVMFNFGMVPEEDGYVADFNTLFTRGRVKIAITPEAIGVTGVLTDFCPPFINSLLSEDVQLNSSMWDNFYERYFILLSDEKERITAMKHELGHILGLTHEHHDLAEERHTQALTPQDTSSIMYYYKTEPGYTGDHNLST